MTHDGFYAHFSSRDGLVAAAIEHAAESTLAYLEAAVGKSAPDQTTAALIASHLGSREWRVVARRPRSPPRSHSAAGSEGGFIAGRE